MITETNIIGTIATIRLFFTFCLYNKAKDCNTPVTIKKSGKTKYGKKNPTIIIYLTSPPPSIIFGLISNKTIKKQRMMIGRTKELIYILSSIIPKYNSIKLIVAKSKFGTLNFIQSV